MVTKTVILYGLGIRASDILVVCCPLLRTERVVLVSYPKTLHTVMIKTGDQSPWQGRMGVGGGNSKGGWPTEFPAHCRGRGGCIA